MIWIEQIDKNSIFQALVLSYTFAISGQVMRLELNDFWLKETLSEKNVETLLFHSAKFAVQSVESPEIPMAISKIVDREIAIWMAEFQFRNFQIRAFEIRTFKFDLSF